MDEKLYVGIGEQKPIGKEINEPGKNKFLFKELLQSCDKMFLSDSSEESHDSFGIDKIVKSLEQNASNNFSDIILSLLQYKSCNKGLEPNFDYQQQNDAPTIARLLGEVLSDFLVGMTKNGDSPVMREVYDKITMVIPYIDFSILERLERNEDFKQTLRMLTKKIESAGQRNIKDLY